MLIKIFYKLYLNFVSVGRTYFNFNNYLRKSNYYYLIIDAHLDNLIVYSLVK